LLQHREQQWPWLRLLQQQQQHGQDKRLRHQQQQNVWDRLPSAHCPKRLKVQRRVPHKQLQTQDSWRQQVQDSTRQHAQDSTRQQQLILRSRSHVLQVPHRSPH
jgi:hypothetical protein